MFVVYEQILSGAKFVAPEFRRNRNANRALRLERPRPVRLARARETDGARTLEA